VGQRVYVDVVPPSANFISGVILPAGEVGSETLNTTSVVFSTVSPNFVNMSLASGATMTFTKRANSTRLTLQMHATGYVSVGAGAVADIGLLVVGSGDYVVGSLVYNMVNQHLQISGVVDVSAGAIPAGDYVVRGRARISGGATFNMDGGDRVSFEVVERV